MNTLRLTDNARRELTELWGYVAGENGESVADNQIARVFAAMDTLLTYPEAGRQRPELRPSVRSYAVPPYLVFYRYADEVVAVLHVVHGSRDLPRLFAPEDVEE